MARDSGMARGSALLEDEDADVCVVGAGIAGISVAYMLALEGKSVVVIDDGPVGRARQHARPRISRTRSTTATPRSSGCTARAAQAGRQSHTAAIDAIEEIVRREGIDCDFERLDGYWSPPGESTARARRGSCEAARRAGVDVSFAEHVPASLV